MVWKSCHGVICVCAGTGEGQGLAAERDREGAEISRNAGEAEHVPGIYIQHGESAHYRVWVIHVLCTYCDLMYMYMDNYCTLVMCVCNLVMISNFPTCQEWRSKSRQETQGEGGDQRAVY